MFWATAHFVFGIASRLLTAGAVELPTLLEPGDSTALQAVRPDYILLRSRNTRLLPGVLPERSTLRAQRARLNLFPDVSPEFVLERFESSGSENYAWYGHLPDDPLSAVNLTVVQGALVLEVISPKHGHYEIQSFRPGEAHVRQFDAERLKGGGHDQTACFVQTQPAGTETTDPDEGHRLLGAGVARVTIDVLMVYTARARELAGSRAAIVAKAQAAINSENSTFSRSDISHRFRLVQTREVGHVASGNLNTELGWVAGNSTVASARDAAGADIVAFISDKDDYNILGVAYQLTSQSGNSGQVYSANYWDTLSGVWPHEVGHNLGCQHNSAGVFSYSSGHYWTDTSSGKQYGSIMSYIGTRVPYFSNPDILYSDEPTGTASRDNARSIDNIGDNVGAYRTAKTLIEPSCTIAASNTKPIEGTYFNLTLSSLNGGPSTSTNARITVALPAGLTLISHNGGTAFNSSTKIWDVPDLVNGATAILVLNVRADPGSAGTSLSPSADLTSIGTGFVDFDLYNNSDSVTITPIVNPAAPPLAPTGVTAASGPGQINLRWSAPANTLSYLVRRSSLAGGPYVTIATGLTNLFFVDSGLLNGTVGHYVVAGVNAYGIGSNSVNVSAIAGAPGSCLADAFVRDGSYATDNYGSDPTIFLKISSTDFNRQAFLRFDVSGMAHAGQVSIRLVPTGGGADIATTSLEFRVVDNVTWNESTITWNNKPAFSEDILTNLTGFVTQRPIEIDVTSFAREKALSDGLLSIGIASTVSGAERSVSFGTRENTTSSTRPTLIYQQPVPRLQVVAASPGTSLIWPASAAGFGLYSSTNLVPPITWQLETNSISVTSSGYTKSLSPTSQHPRYYRLMSP